MQFDPNQFLDMQVNESNSTVSIPVPAGEYTAFVEKVDARPWVSKQDPSKSGVALDLLWSIDDASVKEFLGRDKVTVKQGIMLDITPEGGLDMGKGKNVGLGRVREAVDLNRAGVPFAFSMLTGRAAKVVVSHRPDKDKPDMIYAEVQAVAKL